MKNKDLGLNNNAVPTDGTIHQGSHFVIPKRLGGCILFPRDSSSSSKDNRDEYTEGTDDAGEDLKFDDNRQKLKHYLLTGKKMYVSKVTGKVTTEIPEGGVAIIIPRGKLSLIGSEDECKSNDIKKTQYDSNWEIDDLGRVLFSDNRIRNTINEIISEPTSCTSDLSDSSVITQNLSDEEVIFSYALICLKSRFNYTELKSIFEHISDFENRFPDIANSLFENIDSNQLLQLKRKILKAKLVGPVSKKSIVNPGFETIAQDETVWLPSPKGIFPISQDDSLDADNNLANDKEESLRKKRELLKQKLLGGGHIEIKPNSDISDSGQTIIIPRGGLI